MTTKSPRTAYGFTLEEHAIAQALDTKDPNSRSPAFALQAILQIIKKERVIDFEHEIRTNLTKRIDAAIRDKVTWNEFESRWQLGKGTNVSFKKIVQAAIRWYVNDWDFKRHTRDSEVVYLEDFGIVSWSDEFKHLSEVLMPSPKELTRRIFTSPNDDCFHYLDVIPHADQFVAECGRFDDIQSHRRFGEPANFWRLEAETIFPLLENVKVLSYTIHPIHFQKRRGW